MYERWQFVVGSERTCSGIVNGGFETERCATLVPSGGGENEGEWYGQMAFHQAISACR